MHINSVRLFTLIGGAQALLDEYLWGMVQDKKKRKVYGFRSGYYQVIYIL